MAPYKDPEKQKEAAREGARRRREARRDGTTDGSTAAIGELYRDPDVDAAVNAAPPEPPAGTDTAAATVVSKPAPKKRGLFASGGKGGQAASPRARPPADITDGLEAMVKLGGAFVENAGDLGVGRSIVFTAPTSAKLLGKTVQRFPSLHAFLAIFLGAGTGMVEAQAAFGIPILVGRMERAPETIPATLPVLKSYMRPVLKDMLRAAKEEKKTRDELAKLEVELGDATGMANYSVDKMILCELLGMSEPIADRVISHELSGADLKAMVEANTPPEPVE